jgi:hypothetical protein
VENICKTCVETQPKFFYASQARTGHKYSVGNVSDVPSAVNALVNLFTPRLPLHTAHSIHFFYSYAVSVPEKGF